MPPSFDSTLGIHGVELVTLDSFGDDRGSLTETYRRSWFPGGREMIQGNTVRRGRGAVVGLHYHLHQADLWQVLHGRIRVVLADIRLGSPTRGAVVNLDLDDGTGPGPLRVLYIPPGVAHGFAVPDEQITLTYLVDGYYNPADELGVAWNSIVTADWGLGDVEPVLSAKDLANPPITDIPIDRLPHIDLRTGP